MWGRLLATLGSGALFALLLVADPGPTGVVTGVLGCTLVAAVGSVLGGPAMQSVVPDLVRPGELATAMALNTVPLTLGRIVGSALGSVAVTRVGDSAAFGIAALCPLVSVTLLAVARLPRTARPLVTGDFSVRAAIRVVRRDRVLVGMLLATVAIGLGSEPTLTSRRRSPSTPPAARPRGRPRAFLRRRGDARYGHDHPCTAHARVTALARAGLVAIALGALGAAGAIGWGDVGLAPTFLAFGLVGLGVSWAMTGTSTALQQRVEPHLRGRVMGLWLVAWVGTRPLAATAAGALADLTSAAVAFATLAVMGGATALLGGPGRGRHRRQ